MRDRPHPQHKLEWPGGVVPEWARPKHNPNKRRGKGGKHERQGGSSPSKRERLQKVMAQSGHGSRRNIEILIAQGHITINGEVAKLGDSVGPGDKVKLDGNLIHLRFGEQLPRVLMYHKPEGEIVSRDDPEKRATVFDKLPRVNNGRWVSVGRLDLNTGGLLLFTTNGELANRLTHPRFEVEREYAVRLLGTLTDEQREKLCVSGVDIDGENCKFDSLEDRGGEGSNHWYHVVLREGKNREVRRMMEAVGMMVSRLMRVRFGNVALPGFLKRGMQREMEEEQIQELLNFAGMNEPARAEESESGEVEDEHDNVGNRIDNTPRKAQRDERDDDYWNRMHGAAAAAAAAIPEHEPDGNRGIYGTPVPPPGRQHKQRGGGQGQPPQGPGGPRHRPQGGAGNKAFGKKRGHGQGPPQGQRKQSHNNNDSRGNVAPANAQQAPREGNFDPQAAAPQGAGPAGAARGPKQGQGKPGRNRRNRHRNRERGAQGGGESPPQGSGNREPSA